MKKLRIIVTASLMAITTFSVQAQYGWTQMANFTGAARYAPAGFSIGHYGYVGCGQSNSGTVSDFYRWNQNTNKWTSIAPYPGSGQIGCTSFSIGAKGYVGLGFNGSSAATDLWSYDTTTNAWTKMTTFPGTARFGGYAFVVGNNAYICGGDPGGPPYLTDCWKYNSVNNTWTQIATYPKSEYGSNLLYSIGKYGYAGCSGNDVTLTDSVFQYDTTANKWTAINPVPIVGGGLNASAYFVINDTAYSVSGIDMSGYYIHNVFGYNAATGLWGNFATFPGLAFKEGIGFSIGNYGYVVTGTDSLGAPLSDLWQYGPSVTTGITEIKNNQVVHINLYPNPSNGLVNFTYTNLNTDNAQLIMTDVLGRTISEHTLTGKQGNLSINEGSLPSGIYFYQVNSNGTSVASGKFVVEK